MVWELSASDIMGICPIPHVDTPNIYTHGDHFGESEIYVGFWGFLGYIKYFQEILIDAEVRLSVIFHR